MKVAASGDVGLVLVFDGCCPSLRLACSFVHVDMEVPSQTSLALTRGDFIE